MGRADYLAGYRKVLEVDWDRDGSWDHARSVLEADEFRADVVFGTSRRSNPQRPTIAAGKGKITLYGDDFVPGRSTVFTVAQLQRRYPCRLKLYVGDDVEELWEGWLQAARHRDGIATSFAWEGYLERPGRERKEIAQTAAPAMANTASVLALLRDAYGLSASEFAANVDPTPLGIYSYVGPVARYASEFSRVSGGLPCARRAGDLRLQDPNNRPASVVVFRNTEYLIRTASNEFDIEQVWNKATVSHNRPGIDNLVTVPRYVTVTRSSGDATTRTVTVALPAPPTGAAYEFVSAAVTRTSARVRWYDPDPDDRQNFTRVASVLAPPSIRVTGSISGTRITASVAISGMNSMRTYRDTAAYDGWWRIGWGTYPGANASLQTIVVTVTITYRLTRDETDIPTEVVADDDGGWGPRSLDFEAWFADNAADSVQRRLVALAEPRDIVTVDMPVDQPDDAKTLALSRVDPGDHIGIVDQDAISETEINATVMVMQCRYRIGLDIIDSKEMVCIEAGAVAVVAPGPVRNLAAASGDGEVILTWDAPATGGAVRDYRVEWPADWSSNRVVSAATTTVTGLTNGTDYRFRVRAQNAGGESAWVEVSATPAASTPTTNALMTEAGMDIQTEAGKPIELE